MKTIKRQVQDKNTSEVLKTEWLMGDISYDYDYSVSGQESGDYMYIKSKIVLLVRVSNY